jgi:hypothetical protein
MLWTPSRTRRPLITTVIAGLALATLGASAVCSASSPPSASADWQGGWGSAKGWWGPGWWGTGRFLDVLPWDYQSFWWQGKPYYFGGETFYAWNGDVGKYEQVTPPVGFNQPRSEYVAMSNGIPKLSHRLFAYPEAGQSPAEQMRDQAECLKLASAHEAAEAPKPVVRKPPARGPRGRRVGRRRGVASAATPESTKPVITLSLQHAALAAEATCLEKRHYSVR